MTTDYYDLGRFTWPVTTTSPDAQRWFDRAMTWCYAFHHEEALCCFEQALRADPTLAMAHWGIAYAVGPNYNKPWTLFDDADKARSIERARAVLEQATALAGTATPLERALIKALAARYPVATPLPDQSAWDTAYADAMRRVYLEHRHNLEACALFVESLMDRTPWQMWDLSTGMPAANADTVEALQVFEQVFDGTPAAHEHPGLLHLYVHLMEMSPHPERALRAADRLRTLVPDAGHLVHMATHIDVLCGHYQDVVRWNAVAIAADEKYLARAGANNFYTFYRVHDYHFAAYGAMFLGQSGPALRAATGLIDTIPEALLRVDSPPMADYLEGYVAMKQHVLVRFGRWRDILNQPLPSDGELYCMTTAMIHYARGVAHAAMGEIDAAERARERFRQACARVPDSRRLHNNRCVDLLAVGAAMLDGEIEYRRGNGDVAFDHLRRSVALEDGLPYDEPWGWMQPTRHALGALLLEQGRFAEAEAVYREDLGLDPRISRASHHPDNLWSLHGLHECLMRRGAAAEATLVGQRLAMAQARADVPVKASCFCRLSAGN